MILIIILSLLTTYAINASQPGLSEKTISLQFSNGQKLNDVPLELVEIFNTPKNMLKGLKELGTDVDTIPIASSHVTAATFTCLQNLLSPLPSDSVPPWEFKEYEQLRHRFKTRFDIAGGTCKPYDLLVSASYLDPDNKHVLPAIAALYADELEDSLPRLDHISDLRPYIAKALFENLLSNKALKGETYTQPAEGIGGQSSLEHVALLKKDRVYSWNIETNKTHLEQFLPQVNVNKKPSYGVSFDNKYVYITTSAEGMEAVLHVFYPLGATNAKSGHSLITTIPHGPPPVRTAIYRTNTVYNSSTQHFIPTCISINNFGKSFYHFLLPTLTKGVLDLQTISLETMQAKGHTELNLPILEKFVKWNFIDNDLVSIVSVHNHLVALIYNPITKELTSLNEEQTKEKYQFMYNVSLYQWFPLKKGSPFDNYVNIINDRIWNTLAPKFRGSELDYRYFDFAYLRYLQYSASKHEARVINLLPQKLLHLRNFMEQKYFSNPNSAQEYPHIDLDLWYASHAQRNTDIFKELTKYYVLWHGKNILKIPEHAQSYRKIIKKISPEILKIYPLTPEETASATTANSTTALSQPRPPKSTQSWFGVTNLRETLASLKRGTLSWLGYPSAFCSKWPTLCKGSGIVAGVVVVGSLASLLLNYTHGINTARSSSFRPTPTLQRNP